MKSRTKLNLNQIIIPLIIGIAIGTMYGHWNAQENKRHHWQKKSDYRQHMMDKFSKKLNLTPEQKEKIIAIFDKAHPEMVELQAEVKPKFDKLRNQTQAEIRQELTPKQQTQFDQMNAEREERRKERSKFFSL